MDQEMLGQLHTQLDLTRVGRFVAPQKSGQYQELITIQKACRPRYRAPAAGRNIGEVVRRSGDCAAAEIQTEPEGGEQVALPLDIVCGPVNCRIERLEQLLERRKCIRIRFSFG